MTHIEVDDDKVHQLECVNLTEINDLVKMSNFSNDEGDLLRNEFKIELDANENGIQKHSNLFISRMHQIISNDDDFFTKKTDKHVRGKLKTWSNTSGYFNRKHMLCSFSNLKTVS